MISFYPGPSRVHDEIPAYVKEAHQKGILSMNHRSKEFMDIGRETIALLKNKLNIPENYSVMFASSATECWEIIAQSLIQNTSTHIYNGAFGEKWYQYTQRLNARAQKVQFNPEEVLSAAYLHFNHSDVICLTQNETSNGTQVSNGIIGAIKKNNPNVLIAVDATSSMGGVELNFRAADVWFASVQKCFGLPAGLALMICSPKAIERIQTIGEKNHYNSLLFMKEMIDKNQTVCTPNVLGIYLLMRVLKKSLTIKELHKKTILRAESWYEFFQKHTQFQLLVKNKNARSNTVICITGEPGPIRAIKEKAKRAGYLLGEGYGDLKETTFRIANFPALKEKEIKSLMNFFKK